MLTRVALSFGSWLPKSGRLLYAAIASSRLANSIEEAADDDWYMTGFRRRQWLLLVH